jgi:hypothetical protein
LELRPWCGGRSQPSSAFVGLSALVNSVENLFQATAESTISAGAAGFSTKWIVMTSVIPPSVLTLSCADRLQRLHEHRNETIGFALIAGGAFFVFCAPI